MSILQNKIDFAVIFTATNANPNGDPLGGNRPRTTSDGLGEVSDVCLKRKIRNRLLAEGEDIFVRMQEDLDAEGYKHLSEKFQKCIDENKTKTEKHNTVCEKWFDVRAFGQVFAIKGSKKSKKDDSDESTSDTDAVSLGIRGPVTIQSAFSVEPVTVESNQITKSVNGEEPKKGADKSSDTMGMKHRVAGKAVYVTYGSISPQLAEKTGFSDDDAEVVKNALSTLFEGDESSARPSGSMEIVKVIWFKHKCKGGQYSSAKVHRAVKIDKDGNVTIDKDSIKDLAYEEIQG